MSGPSYEQRLQWIENCVNKLLQEAQLMVDMNDASGFVNISDDTIKELHSSLVALESVVQRLKSKVNRIEEQQG